MKFLKNHPIILNIALMALAICALIYVSLVAIDLFTSHGVSKEVPDVKSLLLDEAINKLENAGFKWEISDSTYNDSYKPGTIIEQDPKAHTNVKALRIIYLTMNATMPKLVTLPALNEISYRQGRSILEGLGFKNIRVETVASPYKELILNIVANGKAVEAGTKLPLNSSIVITIGDGSEMLIDSLGESQPNYDDIDDSGDVDFL